jgi:hypothetical protein
VSRASQVPDGGQGLQPAQELTAVGDLAGDDELALGQCEVCFGLGDQVYCSCPACSLTRV